VASAGGGSWGYSTGSRQRKRTPNNLKDELMVRLLSHRSETAKERHLVSREHKVSNDGTIDVGAKNNLTAANTTGSSA
jgi:hypothetical protein